jgi:hypothetical protein
LKNPKRYSGLTPLTHKAAFEAIANGDLNTKRRHLLQAASALGLLPTLANAQAAYPNKPIRYTVPVVAGGGSDMVGRTVTERWGT